MILGSLFSGIGGLELGIERGLRSAGLDVQVAYQVERSSFCRHILARHWPHAQRFDDVCSVGAALPPVDLLCGGFPCQDVSSAGRGAGLDGARSGLWWEFLRIIEETRPRWIVVENVASGARRWLPAVRRSLGSLGYASVPVGIAACEVGARHRRERVFVVAGDTADVDLLGRHAREGCAGEECSGRAVVGGGAAADAEGKRAQGGRLSGGPVGEDMAHAVRDAADPDRARLALGGGVGGDAREERAPAERDAGALSPGFGLPARPWMVRGVHGLPGGMDGPWKRAGWTPARLRAARIQALGNAVVPAQVEPVGRLIGLVECARLLEAA